MSKENYPENTTMLEKSAWWMQVGGIVAAMVGVIGNWLELTGGGVVVFAGGRLLEGQINKIKK